MPAFTFPSANPNNFTSGNFYIVPVESVPASTATLRSQLAVPAGFAPVPLTGKVATATSLDFADPTLPNFSYPNSLVGAVICRQVGGSPAATDELISFTPLLNGAAQEVSIPPGLAIVPLTLPANGAVQISTAYRYNSGAFVQPAANSLLDGLIHLIGTNNGSAAYSNPAVSGKLTMVYTDINLGLLPDTGLMDRTLTAGGTTAANAISAMDFGMNRIRVGGVAWADGQTAGASTYELWGSNTLPVWTKAEVANAANWTLLTTFPSGGPTAWASGVVSGANANVYWRYLRLTVAGGGPFSQSKEIEFFDSTFQSPTPL